ncbi:MAG TPA: LacI family DNA-binding transcriptional regulator [Bacilli bacterium]|nr:LacI family DNA-binding transcriptional regulator [Bacilli bacterium]
MQINLKYIAEKANLSQTAVSLILNGRPIRVSEEKRNLVLAIAKKHNYQPSALARGLATNKTNIIGLVLPDITNYFFAETALYIETTLREHGYSLILCNSADDPIEERNYIDLLLSYRVDGLLISLSHEALLDEKLLGKLEKLDTACVAFDRFSPNLPFPYVSIDNLYGSEVAVQHLIDNGHRKIGFIGGLKNALSATQRYNGYKNILKKAAIPFNESYIRYGNYQFESGYICGLDLLQNTDITAVFVANDMMAYGFYKAANELGIKVGEDISVVGFDDLFFSANIDVPLTTIRQSTKDLSYHVCDILLKKLNKEKVPQSLVLKPQLTIRNSVKNIKQ